MPFGIIGRTSPGMRQVVGFVHQSTGRGSFGGELGVCHCNQWGLTFAAMRPSSQITLGRFVIIIIRFIKQQMQPHTTCNALTLTSYILKTHTEDEINLKLNIELSAQNKSRHNRP